jgi:hypothetical protein
MKMVALGSLLGSPARKICHSAAEMAAVLLLLPPLLQWGGTVWELCVLMAQQMLKVWSVRPSSSDTR